jgi:hypothetical protein
MRIRRTRILFTLAAVALTATACSDTSTVSGGTAPEPSAAADTTATAEAATTLAPDTTAPDTLPATTTVPPAPATTAAPAAIPAPLVLRGTGVGPYTFGMSYAEVTGGLGTRLEAVTDVAGAYPTADGYGSYFSADGSQVFTAPFGREACWSDGAFDELCLSFGGPAAGSLTFVGWSYGGSTLLADGGFTGGSLWRDFPAIFTPGTAGCYSTSGSSVGDISLSLESTGPFFGSYDESGTFVGPDPAPADVRIYSMTAGSIVGSTEGDC